MGTKYFNDDGTNRFNRGVKCDICKKYPSEIYIGENKNRKWYSFKFYTKRCEEHRL